MFNAPILSLNFFDWSNCSEILKFCNHCTYVCMLSFIILVFTVHFSPVSRKENNPWIGIKVKSPRQIIGGSIHSGGKVEKTRITFTLGEKWRKQGLHSLWRNSRQKEWRKRITLTLGGKVEKKVYLAQEGLMLLWWVTKMEILFSVISALYCN